MLVRKIIYTFGVYKPIILMMKKVKVTHLEYGVVKAHVFYLSGGLYSLSSDINARGIDENNIIKIEFVLEAGEYDLYDETINN